ncbi:MAG: BlaI/MecI/CopY family transcriptional regulator [Candidatus Hydrogenedentes bacterium]|nr:BlaI/MecI/CopY family transcriptional regulator [Candidatus Hydrogenedentota bacterium]
MGPAKPKISELEWEILKALWDNGPMAARDIYALVGDANHWAYKTLKTMLARLVKKGALDYQQVGNSYLYRPVFTREELTLTEARSFIGRVFDGALQPFVAHFAGQISDEELQVLQQELKRIQRERKR